MVYSHELSGIDEFRYALKLMKEKVPDHVTELARPGIDMNENQPSTAQNGRRSRSDTKITT
jgi:hypothetical protein